MAEPLPCANPTCDAAIDPDDASSGAGFAMAGPEGVPKDEWTPGRRHATCPKCDTKLVLEEGPEPRWKVWR